MRRLVNGKPIDLVMHFLNVLGIGLIVASEVHSFTQIVKRLWVGKDA